MNAAEGVGLGVEFLGEVELEAWPAEGVELETRLVGVVGLAEGVELEVGLAEGEELQTGLVEGVELEVGFAEGVELETKLAESRSVSFVGRLSLSRRVLYLEVVTVMVC